MAESEIPAYAAYSVGRWVALCPVDANAMEIELGQTRFECGTPELYGSCGTTADISWPADPSAIEASLAGVPIDERNWWPL